MPPSADKPVIYLRCPKCGAENARDAASLKTVSYFPCVQCGKLITVNVAKLYGERKPE